jgi:hypothetical protein
MTTLLYALKARGKRYGLQTMCEGGGHGQRHHRRAALAADAGRVLVITGAFGVLGSAVAKAAAGQGARVALIDFAKDGPTPTALWRWAAST